MTPWVTLSRAGKTGAEMTLYDPTWCVLSWRNEQLLGSSEGGQSPRERQRRVREDIPEELGIDDQVGVHQVNRRI